MQNGSIFSRALIAREIFFFRPRSLTLCKAVLFIDLLSALKVSMQSSLKNNTAEDFRFENIFSATAETFFRVNRRLPQTLRSIKKNYLQ